MATNEKQAAVLTAAQKGKSNQLEQRMADFKNLLDSGMSMGSVCRIVGISYRTGLRYKKRISQQGDVTSATEDDQSRSEDPYKFVFYPAIRLDAWHT